MSITAFISDSSKSVRIAGLRNDGNIISNISFTILSLMVI